MKPFLWFDNQAEEAANFYISVFGSGKIGQIFRAPEGGPLPVGSAIVVSFEVRGLEFVAMNGGPGHPFTDAISFSVDCADQAEIDNLWQKLTENGGQEIACGWLRDKYGLSWQIVPANVTELLRGKDAAGGARAFQAMMQMKKLDIAELKRAGGLA
ncbi:MAG TPA: VOC family protein [Acidobacteriaceae bacterium]|nr:VOC family protein [Acidobacteriaceae bacterium]